MAKYLLLHDEQGKLMIVKRKRISLVVPHWQGKEGKGASLTNDLGDELIVRETVEEIAELLAKSGLHNPPDGGMMPDGASNVE